MAFECVCGNPDVGPGEVCEACGRKRSAQTIFGMPVVIDERLPDDTLAFVHPDGRVDAFKVTGPDDSVEVFADDEHRDEP